MPQYHRSYAPLVPAIIELKRNGKSNREISELISYRIPDDPYLSKFWKGLSRPDKEKAFWIVRQSGISEKEVSSILDDRPPYEEKTPEKHIETGESVRRVVFDKIMTRAERLRAKEEAERKRAEAALAFAVRNKKIWDMRKNGATLQAVADHFHLSRERIRSIVSHMDRKIRGSLIRLGNRGPTVKFDSPYLRDVWISYRLGDDTPEIRP